MYQPRTAIELINAVPNSIYLEGTLHHESISRMGAGIFIACTKDGVINFLVSLRIDQKNKTIKPDKLPFPASYVGGAVDSKDSDGNIVEGIPFADIHRYQTEVPLKALLRELSEELPSKKINTLLENLTTVSIGIAYTLLKRKGGKDKGKFFSQVTDLYVAEVKSLEETGVPEEGIIEKDNIAFAWLTLEELESLMIPAFYQLLKKYVEENSALFE